MLNLGLEMHLEGLKYKNQKMLYKKDKLNREEKPTLMLRKWRELRPQNISNGRRSKMKNKLKDKDRKKIKNLK